MKDIVFASIVSLVLLTNLSARAQSLCATQFAAANLPGPAKRVAFTSAAGVFAATPFLASHWFREVEATLEMNSSLAYAGGGLIVAAALLSRQAFSDYVFAKLVAKALNDVEQQKIGSAIPSLRRMFNRSVEGSGHPSLLSRPKLSESEQIQIQAARRGRALSDVELYQVLQILAGDQSFCIQPIPPSAWIALVARVSAGKF